MDVLGDECVYAGGIWSLDQRPLYTGDKAAVLAAVFGGEKKRQNLVCSLFYGEEEPVLQKPVSSVSGDFRTGPLQRGKSYKVALITSSSICAKLGMVAFDPSCWEAEAGESMRVWGQPAYRANSRPTMATYWDSVFKLKKKKKRSSKKNFGKILSNWDNFGLILDLQNWSSLAQSKLQS